MSNQAAVDLMKFVKEVRALNPEDKPVLLNINSKPHQMTFLEFVMAWYNRTLEVISKRELPPHHDPMSMLRTEHQDQVLQAILEGEQVPLPVLREYRFKSDFFKPIRKYCRLHKIDLDA